jgi:DNA-directed RNA polymerase specialized sigma24 family protein
VAHLRSGVQPAPDSGDLLLVAAGDDAALTRLVARWRQPVDALFERTREPSAAAEATVLTFERLVLTAPRYAPASPFPALLWSLVAKVVQDAKPGEVLEIPASKLAESPSARTALVRSAIAALPAGERSAFLLTRVARLSATAAAEALSVSETEVRRRLVRALESLRVFLRPVLEVSGSSPALVGPEALDRVSSRSGRPPAAAS